MSRGSLDVHAENSYQHSDYVCGIIRDHFTEKWLGAQTLDFDHLGSNSASITY